MDYKWLVEIRIAEHKTLSQRREEGFKEFLVLPGPLKLYPILQKVKKRLASVGKVGDEPFIIPHHAKEYLDVPLISGFFMWDIASIFTSCSRRSFASMKNTRYSS